MHDFPLSIRQGATGRCDQNNLGSAEKWTSTSPCLEGQGGAVIVAVEVRDSFGAVSKPKTIQVISQWPKLESEAAATAATGALLGRGIHSSTFQLNRGRFRHNIHPSHPPIPPNTP